MIIYRENLSKSTEKLLELVRKFIKVARYGINM